MKGNRNRAKACVAVTGSHSLPFWKARCTECKSRGGEVTSRATAMEKWPSGVQCEVTETPGAVLKAGRKARSLLLTPPEKVAIRRDLVPVQLPRA